MYCPALRLHATPRGNRSSEPGDYVGGEYMTTSTVTITRTVTNDDDLVFVDATCEEGDDLSLTEALGMIELAKATLIGQTQ